MSIKQLANPRTQPEGEIAISRAERTFDKLYLDIPSGSAPKGSFSKLINAISFPHEIKGREGVTAISGAVAIPSITTGFTASKSTTTITATVGTFTSSEIGNYFVWPDGDHDQIVRLSSSTAVVVRRSGTKASTSGCYTRGAGFGAHWHKHTNTAIRHYGTKLYASPWSFSSNKEIYPISEEYVSKNKSYMFDFGNDYVLIINNGNIFKVLINSAYPYYYKINSKVPDQLLTEITFTDKKIYKRRYIYSCSRLTGKYYWGSRIGDSNTDATNYLPTLKIEQETGTTKINTSFIDYADIATEKKIGLGNKTYGVIIGGTGASGHSTGINKNISEWQALTNAGCSINMNSLGQQDIWFNFEACLTLDDVCLTIKNALRVYVPSATCEIDVDETSGLARFKITTGEIDGSTITAISNDPIGSPTDATLTDISGYETVSNCGLLCTAVEGGVVASGSSDPTNVYEVPNVIGDLKYAKANNGLAQKHFTHFTLYASKDIGAKGIDPNTGIGNDPNVLVYVKDVPIISSFTCDDDGSSASVANLMTASSGRFLQEDKGSTVTFQDGTSSVIQYLCDVSGNKVYTADSLYAIGNSTAAISSQSAAIGATTIRTCSRSGSTVTKVSGNSFTSSDAGKAMFWSDGTITWIRQYVNATTVYTIDSGSKGQIACAMDPSQRKFCDTVNDDTINSRIGKNIFLATNRKYVPLPSCNIGVAMQSFLVVGMFGKSIVHYSQRSNEREYLCGYYNDSVQYDDSPREALTFIDDDSDYIILRTRNSTFVISTNGQTVDTNDETGSATAILPAATLVADIGVIQTGTIKSCGQGTKIMVCSDFKWRTFSNGRYSEDLSIHQIQSQIKKTGPIATAHYNPISGYIVWFPEKE